MDDWLTSIGISGTGLPWWAAFILILLTWLATKGVDAALKWRRANMDERQYEDGEAKMAREQLVKELKDRVDKLEKTSDALTTKLAEANLAHANCEIQQAKLQAKLDIQAERMNAMQLQIDRLMTHDKANQDNKKQLAEFLKEETGKQPPLV